jgi:hypothetical protein
LHGEPHVNVHTNILIENVIIQPGAIPPPGLPGHLLAGHPFFLFVPMTHYFSHKEIKNRRKKCVKDVNSHARRKKKEK